ncbi:MAG: protease pro-enzyme activation domain-containing protein [Chloroflexia bacterium]
MYIRNHKWVVPGVLLLALLLALPMLAGAGKAGAAPSGPRTLSADSVPAEVRSGQAKLLGPHAAAAPMDLLFMLPMRDKVGLDAFLADVSNPQSPNFGHYLTQEEANARFNPDTAHEKSVEAWLGAHGITVLDTVPNHLYVKATATSGAFQTLLGVQINDYSLPGRTFYSLDRPVTLPAEVSADVQSVVGLTNIAQFHTFNNGLAHGAPAYYPQDMANAYDVNPLWAAGYTGAGTTVALTLWGAAPTDGTLNTWAAATNAAVATRANGRLIVIPVDGGSTFEDAGEAGLDIESSGGIAYQAQIRYYEARTNSSGQPDLVGLTDTLNRAGTDSVFNRQISSSWGGDEDSSLTSAFEPVFSSNAATGHDYLFSSGDSGSSSNSGNGDPYPAYPASSPYVTSVGGTRFNGDVNPNWPGEDTWLYVPPPAPGPEGSGGGYSLTFANPSWEVAPGFNNTHRGYPDVAAVADPATGYYVCYGNSSACAQYGGTSLSSPLWAGMMAITNQYLVAQGRPVLGFANPRLYQLANTPQTFPAYHDITAGTNGVYNAGPGWDAVTGLGSPDLWNVARDLAGVSLPPTATPTLVSGQHFTDVPPANPFYVQINWCADHGIVSGYANGDGTFRYLPNNSATRAQVSKMIVIADGWAIDTTGGPHFTDVSTTNPFYGVIETAYNHGVISGYNDHTFHPYSSVTRSQFSKIIVLSKGWAINTTGGPHFRDVPSSNPFYGVIETAYNHGIVSGYTCGGPGEPCPGTYFRPYNNITRAQLAKLIYFSFGP